MISAFEYQLEVLKAELDYTNSAIRQMDEMMKSTKNWAIATWTASLGIVIAAKSLNPFIGLTVIIPILFWIVDANYRRLQNKFIFRNYQISDFLNDERFKQSFAERQLINFTILDPKSKGSLKDPSYKKDYEEKVNISNVLLYTSVCFLYIGLIIISIIVHLIFNIFIVPSGDNATFINLSL